MMNARIYGSVNAVFHEMHHTYHRVVNKLLEEMHYTVNFQYVASSGCITFTYTKNAEDVISVEFSNDMAKMLGFKANKQYTQRLQKETKAEKLLHLSVIMNNVYIYCNLLEHYSGRNKTPLLHIVNRKTICESGIQQHQIHIRQCQTHDIQCSAVCASAEKVLRHLIKFS